MNGVLVTGATTPLGRGFLQTLLDDGQWDPILAVGAEEQAPNLPGIASGRVLYRAVDLTRPREIHRLLFGPVRQLGIENIVHGALHRSALLRGPKVHALDVGSTRELLEHAETHPTVRRLVFRSYGDVYRVDPARPVLITEDHPLELSNSAPQRVLDRVEADLLVCTRMGLSRLCIVVLRCAEVVAPDMGSQLFDYLQSRVCFRPLGFDPMLNLLSLDDAASALRCALITEKSGIFNIPGADTLPLSLAIEKWGRTGVPVPGPLLAPLYRARAEALGLEFRYDLNYRRFHFSAVLDGKRAGELLGYRPSAPMQWPAGDSARSLVAQ
jgi:UDP-glucose 4-epimerase